MNILGERHLHRVLQEDATYFNGSRPHQGINQRVSERNERSSPSDGSIGTVIAFPILSGLHHEYRRVAYVAVSKVQRERMAKGGTTTSAGIARAIGTRTPVRDRVTST